VLPHLPSAYRVTRRRLYDINGLPGERVTLSACQPPTIHHYRRHGGVVQPDTMKKISSPVLLGLALMVVLSLLPVSPGTGFAQSAPAVPAEYQALASTLQGALDAYRPSTPSIDGPTHFGGEFFLANSNRGEVMLGRYAYDNIPLALDQMRALGFAGVTISAHEDVLVRSSRAPEFVEFYRRVAQDVRARGMILVVETQATFAGSYASLTFDQYRQSRRQAVEVILREMQPHYLSIASEPDTEAKLTGYPELSTLDGYTTFLASLLENLERGTTLVGAGTGSWHDLAWPQRFVQLPIDFLNVHIYPVTRDFLQRAADMSAVARQSGKRAVIGEAWLYKVTDGELLWAPPNFIFKRDAYSFWQPLDQLFLRTITGLARTNGFDYASVFWSQYLFAYLDYAEAKNYSYWQSSLKINTLATDNVRLGVLSPTGAYYRDLIASPEHSGAPTRATPTPAAVPTATVIVPAPTTTAPTSLTAPSALSARAIPGNQIVLAWTDNTPNESGFKVERSNDGTRFYPLTYVGADVTTYTDTGQRANRTYHYRVRAFKGFVNSAYSNTASGTTLP
jgi:hypothetical protein